ncbi:MAG: phosphatidylserine/phosphatidylglycerophosphate/cardiolipin synthase family protein, partial [Bacteroides sp.]
MELLTAQTAYKQTTASTASPTVSDSLAMAFFKELGVPITNGNRVELFFNGHDKFEDLFSAIRQARHHIHLEYFNFRNDSIA